MKPWMKVLMWFGLGGIVGYFAGSQIGYNNAKHEDEEIINDAYRRGRMDAINPEAPTIYKVEELTEEDVKNIMTIEEYQEMMRKKYGYPDPEWRYIDNPAAQSEDEDAEMPMDEPIVPEPENEGVHVVSHEEVHPDGTTIQYGTIEGPGDIIHGRKMSDIESVSALFDDPPTIPDSAISQFHPTFLDIRVVDETEYDTRGDLDEETLLFYEGDEVLFNCRTQEIIPSDEYNATIGVATLEGFRVGPGPAKDELWVINENNCRYHIMRLDDAFTDAVDGNCAPTDDYDEDDV